MSAPVELDLSEMPGAAVERVRQSASARAGRAAPFALAASLVSLVGFANGGYFAGTWGWISLALAWTVAVALLVRSSAPRPLELLPPGALLTLAVYTLGTGSWATGAAGEAQRTLIYVLTLVAAVATTRRAGASALAGGALAGIVCVATFAVATRLFPDRLGAFDSIAGNRLAEPLGYWNALGIFAAIGIPLSLGFAARAHTLAWRCTAGAGIVPLALALYFTFSRGGWIALALGFVAAVAFDRRRVSLVTWAAVLLPGPALTIWFAATRDALTSMGSPLTLATDQGADVALVASACAASTLATVVVLAWAQPQVTIGPRAAHTYARTIGALVLAALIAVFLRFGPPWTIAAAGWKAFSAPPTAVTDLNDRLFSFSGSGRVEQWQVALDAWRDEPVRGIGAGGYERYWLEHREVAGKIRDAHSLYIETLAELGPLGLALLLLALGVPVYAAFKARGHPLVPAAVGAYVAYLVHAGVDWDWEMPAVTLTALFIGASIVVAARKPEDEERPMGPRLRYSLLAGTLALAAVAFVGLVGNMALAQSADAARAADWEESERKARRAATWAPWSPEPWQQIGESQLARGELGDARASFRKAIAKDEGDWSLWLDLARASEGSAQLDALAQATRLNPLSPEVAQLRTELGELGTIEVGG